jgi:methylenetetrahydrofolate dehydrogenase (NADP+)/methenyltetrahydrofolate cyclohydrolase
VIYVNNKIKACKEVGITTLKIDLPETLSENELLQNIGALNRRKDVDGILVQLPLPAHINVNHVTLAIDPAKDVDGLHPINMGKLFLGQEDGFTPCTPLGIKTLFERYNIDVTGKNVVMLGRSNIVGKPMAALLIQRNATVTIAHSYTKNIKAICQQADIIVVAIGKSKFLTADMVKEGAVVIDVGISRIEDETKAKGYHLGGDVDFPALEKKCSHITPVPGGVGPMTIAMLLKNTLKAYRKTHAG